MAKKRVSMTSLGTNVRYIKEIKMIDNNRIIEEYRNANSEKRLYLFL